ncbi:putative sugar transporter [Microdochium bolleyi]|uniref:Putative sugar transporter n=1 Tax=Microdochium bolleyi TaxID=196109 RepID=A0A136J3A3_9PEZI|nr:putative sugar transporter [Microdochium bolleyi]
MTHSEESLPPTSDVPLSEKDAKAHQLTPQQSHVQGDMLSVGTSGNANPTNVLLAEEAIQAIGMGRYQWQLAVSAGFGFLVDQILLVSISLVGPQASYEFGPTYPTLLSAALYAGLLVGAITIGLAADNLGRRNVWLASIFLVSIFSLVAASSPTWAALNVFITFAGFFGGGNLAIDLTMLSECLPARWGFVLTGLAGIWGLGNAITGLIAWPLLSTFGCPAGSTPATCARADNMGWRYLYITIGGLCLLMSLARALVVRSRESPKWLVSCGRVEEAVDVLNSIAQMNGSDHRVSLASFEPADHAAENKESLRENCRRAANLFKGPKKMRLMLCLMGLWGMVGITYPLYTIFLPYFLQSHGQQLGDSSTYKTYRDWTISSIVGIFGPLMSMALVSTHWFRSRYSLTATAFICAIFSGAFTLVKSDAQNLASSCMINFWLNAFYAIIYSYTPQALSTENRGLGCGLLMACGRLASLSAPFIATFADVTSSAPIFVSCALYVVMGLIALLLPIDTAGFRTTSTAGAAQ